MPGLTCPEDSKWGSVLSKPVGVRVTTLGVFAAPREAEAASAQRWGGGRCHQGTGGELDPSPLPHQSNVNLFPTFLPTVLGSRLLCSKAGLLTLQRMRDYLGILPHPDSHPAGLGQGLRICISNTLHAGHFE